MCLTASFLATGGFSKFMYGLQACILKHITVPAFRIYALRGENAAKRGGWRSCLKSHGNYIVDHGKSWKNHGILFLTFCGNPGSVAGYHSVSVMLLIFVMP